ncbi:MAG: hypothetical protein JSW10_07925 [Pseudomonadota bacterium]|nr:MAG: hypothetical protein JSW10_07925 [Pseudomonadota bacterium]
MRSRYAVLVGLVLAAIGSIVFWTGPALAGDTPVGADELKALLSGNTAEGRYIKWETTHKMFFDASGEIRRVDSLNNEEKGEWYVNKQGELCISVRKERCSEVTMRDDGGYNASRKGTLVFTFDKIVSGNPHNL